MPVPRQPIIAFLVMVESSACDSSAMENDGRDDSARALTCDLARPSRIWCDDFERDRLGCGGP